MRWKTIAIYGGIGVGAYLLYRKLMSWQPNSIKSDELRDGGISMNTGIVPPSIVMREPAPTITARIASSGEGSFYVPKVWAGKGEEFWDIEV